jgi:hypothetical protein
MSVDMRQPCCRVHVKKDIQFIYTTFSLIILLAYDLHNLRGQQRILKPDAANPRQVDALVGI